jgi:hypothetical protein
MTPTSIPELTPAEIVYFVNWIIPIIALVISLGSLYFAHLRGSDINLAMPEWTDFPWLTEVPTTGIPLANDVYDITISFDSMTYTPVTYIAALVLMSNDSLNSKITIPVIMKVIAPRLFFIPIVSKP